MTRMSCLHPMFRLFRSTLLAALLAAMPPAGAGAATATGPGAIDPNAPIPTGQQVKVGMLPNGLTYYIQQNPDRKVELRLVVKAGSVLEDDDQQGLAHMVAHLAFDGSRHFKREELVGYLQSIGLDASADQNAVTRFDETVYKLRVPSDRKENLDTAFTVLEDWAHGLTLDEADIDKERLVLLATAHAGEDVQERAQRALVPKLYKGSRYAVREPAGKEDVIRTAGADAVRRFYGDWYRPDLMAVIVVGDIDPQDAERQIRAHFAGIANPAQARTRDVPAIPARLADEAHVFLDDEKPIDSVTVHYPARLEPEGTYGAFLGKTVDDLVQIMMTQRLTEMSERFFAPLQGGVALKQPLSALYQENKLFAVFPPGGAKRALDALLQVQRDVYQHGFTALELALACRSTRADVEYRFKTRMTADSADLANNYQRNFLANSPIPGIEAEYRMLLELLPAITLDDVNAAARTMFPADAARLVAYAGSTKSGPPPSAQQLLAQIAGARKALVAQPDDMPSKPSVTEK